LVEKEAAESEYWLEVVREAELANQMVADSLAREANELLRIFGSARRTSKERHSQIGNRKSKIGNIKG
jgi:four helix bundle protein